MSIVISHLDKSYAGKSALSDVSFQVGSSEVVAFLGPNGAGKSTLLRILTGSLLPDHGEVSICGHSPFEDPLTARASFGYLAENNPLYSEMYVTEYLTFISKLRGEIANNRVKEVLNCCMLTEVSQKKIAALSKGFRQRVGLAAALLPDAPVLLLDEPLSGLDPNQQESILNLIQDLRKTKSILFSTHTLSEVEKVADRVLILSKGVLKTDTTLDKIEQEGGLEKRFKEDTNENV